MFASLSAYTQVTGGDFIFKSTVLHLANCCIETYNQYKNNGTFQIPSAFTLVTPFEATIFSKQNLFGFIIESETTIIVSFRGTKTEREWLADFDINKKKFPYVHEKCFVHEGIFNIYQTCRDTILTHLNKLSPAKEVFITGHSLGGALSTLLTLDAIHSTKFTNIQQCSFASPKVGDISFKKLFQNVVTSSLRFVNIYDLIPLLPPSFTKSNNATFVHTKEIKTFAYDAGSLKLNHQMETYKKGIEQSFSSTVINSTLQPLMINLP